MKRYFSVLISILIGVVPMVRPVLADPVVDPLLRLVDPVVDPLRVDLVVEGFSYELVINEVSMGSEKNPEKDIWIEFYNPTDEIISLDDWQIRGVTEGGTWVQLVNEPGYIVEPKGYFLYSRYSNSASSALAIKPDFVKSSFVFPDIVVAVIEIRSPDGVISDGVELEKDFETPFYSFERSCEDYFLNEWLKPTESVNLKDDLAITYATPGAVNSNCESVVEDPVVLPEVINVELINEVMVNPMGSDREGEWVELYNPTDEPIDLTDYYIDDGEGASKPYLIDRTIYPHSYLVLRGPDMDLSFKNSEDVVRLLGPNEQLIQSIEYTGAIEDYSLAKTSLGEFVWTPIITLGKANQFPPPPKPYEAGRVRFNKVLPNPGGSDSNREKIILENQFDEWVDLSGWGIINKTGKKYVIDDLGIDAQAILKFNPSHIDLNLANTADQLRLVDPVGNVIDQIQWENIESDEWVYPNDYFKDGISAVVTEVLDGDTFKILFDNQEWTVRLLGLDAPETIHPTKPIGFFGPESSQYLKELLQDRVIHLAFDQDKMDTYKRLLAYVYVDNIFVNTHLLQEGYAKLYRDFPFKLKDEFYRYEEHARNLERGVWSSVVDPVVEPVVDPLLRRVDPVVDSVVDPPRVEPVVVPEVDPLIHRVKTVVDDFGLSDEICSGEGLKIHSILPNEEVGASVEYIQLINTTDSEICLKGWQLDDELDKGSKPFVIQEGVIEPASVKVFSKSITKINLNNSNDCAYLINPFGEVADSICYKTIGKGEVITHESLLAVQQKTSSSSSASSSVKSTVAKAKVVEPKMNRDAVSYQWDLKNETIHGLVTFVYDEGKMLYVQQNEKVIPISYANSNINVSMAKQLLDLGQPVELDVRSTEDHMELIGIKKQVEVNSDSETSSAKSHFKIDIEWCYLALLLFMLGFGIFVLSQRPIQFEVRAVH